MCVSAKCGMKERLIRKGREHKPGKLTWNWKGSAVVSENTVPVLVHTRQMDAVCWEGEVGEHRNAPIQIEDLPWRIALRGHLPIHLCRGGGQGDPGARRLSPCGGQVEHRTVLLPVLVHLAAAAAETIRGRRPPSRIC